MLRKRSHIENSNSSDEEERDPQMDIGAFDKFNISKGQQKALIANGIKYLFPIQSQTFNSIFEGKDILAKDRTGSGKTLAFSLPSLEKFRNQNLFKNKRGQKPLMLVLVPTRELAIQVSNELKKLKIDQDEFRIEAIYG